MQTINYTISFFSDWHCGSGLSAGADADALVVKDRNQLPLIPGKTLKGLLREAVEQLFLLKLFPDLKTEQVDELFGSEFKEGESVNGAESHFQGCAFFSNAELEESIQNHILKNEYQSYLYRNVASTAIDPKTGTAKPHSLRTMQVCVPCILHAYIGNVPDEMVPVLQQAMRYVKRLGVDRNRGLGRCSFYF